MSAGRVLVVAEVALAPVLLASSGVMVQSHERLLAIDPGCDARKLLTVRMAVHPAAWPATRFPIFYNEVVARLGARPGCQCRADELYAAERCVRRRAD